MFYPFKALLYQGDIVKWLNIKVSDKKLTSGYLVEIIDVIKSVYPLGGLTKPVAIYMEVTRKDIGSTNFYLSPAISAIIQLKANKDGVFYRSLNQPPDANTVMLIFGRNVFCYSPKMNVC